MGGIARAGRALLALCGIVVLLVGSVAVVSAQGTIDPNADSDGDGIPNHQDPDDDEDGVWDLNDYYPLDPSRSVKEADPPPPSDIGTETGQQVPNDPIPPPPAANPPSGSDNDRDGIEDRFDPDDDNDGVIDELDSAPFDPNVGSAPPPSIIDHDEDSDGDGIANSHDPDDDNDGVQDDQDSHPFDPTRGEKPPPSIISPDHDSDGDGIANSHDPDDDNDGVTDELDCAPFDPTITTCPSGEPTPAAPEGPGTTPTQPNPPNGGGTVPRGPGGSALLVTTLPNTGSGAHLTQDSDLSWVAALLAATAATIASRIARHWYWRTPRPG